MDIFDKIDLYKDFKIRYIGISVSNFMEYKKRSFDILKYEQDLKFKKLGDCIKTLRDKHGIDIVKNGCEI